MGLFDRLTLNASKLNEWHYIALYAYIFYGDEAAGFAAYSTGMVMAKEQRASAITYAHKMAAHLRSIKQDDETNGESEEVAVKLELMAAKIGEKNWGMLDVIKSKKILGAMAPHYLKAQNGCDPDVFVREYPEMPDLLGRRPG